MKQNAPRWIGGGFMALAIAIAGTMTVHYETGGKQINNAYWDRYGHVWTICDGHTQGIKRGDYATDAQCDAYRNHDEAVAYKAVDRCIHTALTVTQAAAFTDGVLNLGPALVCGSTLQRKANAGDIAGACKELTDALNARGVAEGWTYAGGKRLPGLITRRGDERSICDGGLR